MKKSLKFIGLGSVLVLAISVQQANAVLTPNTAKGSTTQTTLAPRQEGDDAGRLLVVLNKLVADNTITQSQLDAIMAALKADKNTNSEQAKGRGEDKSKGEDNNKGQNKGGINSPKPLPVNQGADRLSIVASTLGISLPDLKTALVGKSIATVSGDKISLVTAALRAPAVKYVQDKLASNTLTQAQADAALAKADKEIAEFINKVVVAKKENKK